MSAFPSCGKSQATQAFVVNDATPALALKTSSLRFVMSTLAAGVAQGEGCQPRPAWCVNARESNVLLVLASNHLGTTTSSIWVTTRT